MTTRVDPALEVSRDVVDRLAAAERHVGRQRRRCRRRARGRDLEGRRACAATASRTAAPRAGRPARRAVGAWRPSRAVAPSTARRARGSARGRAASKSGPRGSPCASDREVSERCVRRHLIVLLGPVFRVDRTYSALRSQVQTVDECPPPAPRSTVDVKRPCPSGIRPPPGRARRTGGRPRRAPSCRSDRRARQVEATPARPATAMRRPQFGSPPCTAVFTSGEFAIALRRLPRLGRRCRAGDGDRNELGRALAAAHDAERELAADARSPATKAA